ncbi:hypothetical protein [Hymenobacter roseosalivarius]|nr:hypothetical protein [Hymenobacter roseosalivarius]
MRPCQECANACRRYEQAGRMGVSPSLIASKKERLDAGPVFPYPAN